MLTAVSTGTAKRLECQGGIDMEIGLDDTDGLGFRDSLSLSDIRPCRIQFI